MRTLKESQPWSHINAAAPSNNDATVGKPEATTATTNAARFNGSIRT